TYRWVENLHIVLWLLKDTSWALEFKPGAIFMIAPTIAVAFFILWKSRAIRTEVFHNVAVCCWIIANSAWMLGEFVEYETRPLAASIFGIGLVVLAVYYLLYFKKDRRKEKQLNT